MFASAFATVNRNAEAWMDRMGNDILADLKEALRRTEEIEKAEKDAFREAAEQYAKIPPIVHRTYPYLAPYSFKYKP